MEEEKINWLNPKNIINQTEYSLIEGIATCPICLGILIDPVICNICDNCFCSRCLEKWKEIKNTKDCVYKCKNIDAKESNLMKKVLANLKFKCENDCGKEVKYCDLKEHYAKTCPKLDYKKKLSNLLKKKDVYAEQIKEFNLMLMNLEENIKQKDNKQYFDDKIKEHPCYGKHRNDRGIAFGLRNTGLFGFPNN